MPTFGVTEEEKRGRGGSKAGDVKMWSQTLPQQNLSEMSTEVRIGSGTKSLRLGWNHHERKMRRSSAWRDLREAEVVSATTVPWPGDPHRPQASVYQSDGRMEHLSAGEGVSLSLSLSLSELRRVCGCVCICICVCIWVCVCSWIPAEFTVRPAPWWSVLWAH